MLLEWCYWYYVISMMLVAWYVISMMSHVLVYVKYDVISKMLFVWCYLYDVSWCY